MDTPTAVYRLYDRDHQLLYVGISSNPPQRFREHEVRVKWWHLVADIEIGPWLLNPKAAYEVEREVQRGEYPLYNAGWTVSGARTPATDYDDSGYMSAITSYVRAGVRSGSIPPGYLMRAQHLAEQFKCSRLTASLAMDELRVDSVLGDQGPARNRTLSVADREAIMNAKQAARLRARLPQPSVYISGSYVLE